MSTIGEFRRTEVDVPDPAPGGPFPDHRATVDTTTPTLSSPDDDEAVTFEVWDRSRTSLLASGRGQATDTGDRSQWTVPDGVLADGEVYAWRAVNADEDFAEFEVHNSSTTGVPALPPEPGAVSEFTSRPVDGGLLLSWAAPDPGAGARITGYRITLSNGERAERIERADSVVSGLDPTTEYQCEISTLNQWSAGAAVRAEPASPALSPLDGGEAERIATEFLRARGRLLTNEDARRDALSTVLPSSPRADSIGEALADEAGRRIELRDHLGEHGLRYTDHRAQVIDSVLVAHEPNAVTLHARVLETLDQVIGADDAGGTVAASREAGISSFEIALRDAGSGWVITSAVEDPAPESLAPEELAPEKLAPEKLAESDSVETPPTPAEQDAEPSRASTADGGPTAVSSEKMLRYAKKWWSGYNDRFHRWDNDCTNFASQCAAAGGLSYIRGFYRSRGAWWHTGSWPFYASFTWSAAHNLYRHLWENERAAFRKSWSQAVPGDLLFWSYRGNGKIDHVSVINAVRNGIPFYAQHTKAAWNKSIHKGLHGHPKAEVYIAHVTG